jgi:hypothetical protein
VTSIFALAVLADDDPVKVARLAVAERRLGSPQDLGGPNVGILLERLADGQTKTPQRNVIRDVFAVM